LYLISLSADPFLGLVHNDQTPEAKPHPSIYHPTLLAISPHHRH
jgi:hypothetical protein